MAEDEYPTGIVDSITQFAMRQTSRRGFVKWVAKVGLAMAAAAGGGLAFVSTAFASIDCQKYYPGCSNGCFCVSCCEDPDSGYQCCYGCCDYCAPEQLVEITVFWYWDPGLHSCQMVKDCVNC